MAEVIHIQNGGCQVQDNPEGGKTLVLTQNDAPRVYVFAMTKELTDEIAQQLSIPSNGTGTMSPEEARALLDPKRLPGS